ncbi:hypothetical protein COY05_03885 [Candidatus Peregrinibacteria bacterium CG_4_10_14_0_2_um_filter_38_24]|nr:MAG: hypothetical protein COY05_03885 [Candidatus Peregrinibacteria bacterium CG_4_10_14_0_2_um_filter_38_24]
MKKFKSILITLILLSLFPTTLVAKANSSFSDITAQELYPEAIQFLYNNQVVKGYDDGTFKPENTINRAEMIKIIAEAKLKYNNLSSSFLEDYSSLNCFTDVPTYEWYTKYVCYGKEQGWIIGYENGQYFRPENAVSFVEALKITFEGFDLSYIETSPIWYKGLVQTASVNNYIPFDIYNFNGTFKRNQMADLITRILKYKEGESSMNNYLGDRKDVIVTYETIDSGLNLSTTMKNSIMVPDPDPVVDPIIDPIVTKPDAPFVYFNYLSMKDTSFDITVYNGFNDGGKPIVSYNIYDSMIFAKPELFKVLYKEGNKESIFTINNLVKDKEYAFLIKAVNEAGLESESGDWLFVTSGAQVYYINQFADFKKPELPNVSVMDQTSSYITLNFTAPVKGPEIEHYYLEIRDGDNYVPYKTIALSDFKNGKKDGSITISGLTENKEYDMRIGSVSLEKKWVSDRLVLKFIAKKNGYNSISKE